MMLQMKTERDSGVVLTAIKALHTVVWAFFVACIVAVPATASLHRFRLTALFTGLVLLECLVLAVNRCRCPLTDAAARFAPEDAPNFDIYLPAWLAQYNKQIFGTLFVFGGLFALAEWLMFKH
jgi:hypothetical protein